MIILGIATVVIIGATVAAPVTLATEPILTWNLFLTGIIVPLGLFLLFFAIKRLFNEKDAKDQVIITMQKEAEATKAAMIKERYDAFSSTLCHVKERVEELVAAQNERVTWEHCNNVHRELRQDMKHLNGRIVTP